MTKCHWERKKKQTKQKTHEGMIRKTHKQMFDTHPVPEQSPKCVYVYVLSFPEPQLFCLVTICHEKLSQSVWKIQILRSGGSRKLPERPRKRSQSFPWNFPSRSLSPSVRLGTPLFFRSGSGGGLSELVMEFVAVLRVFLIVERSSKRGGRDPLILCRQCRATIARTRGLG